MKYPKIGVYAGSGTSHSWLWFVDLFEKAGFCDLVFLDEFSVQNNDIKDLDVLVVSGGDTFAVAQSLGKAGGQHIKSFVEHGGVYIGSCAGAYLPMKSSQKPLDWFNFVDVKITNLSKLFPNAQVQTCKSCAAYGYDFVFHPVREAVSLKTTSFFDKDKSSVFTAPLYGGPGMKAHDPSWVLAVYEGFTPKTVFFTTREIAEKTLAGNGAVVRVPCKKGCFYLLGPHLEHPKFKQANQFIIDAIISETDMVQDHEISKYKMPKFSTKEKLSGKEAKELLLCIKRELSNSRIVAGSLEFLPVQWLIGQKVYEPQKVRVYLEAMWKRLRFLEKNKVLILEPGLYGRITRAASQITLELRSIKQQIDENRDSLKTAIIIFDLLHVLATSFFDLYFATMFNGLDKYHEHTNAHALEGTTKYERDVRCEM
ncbi:MAG: Type 1 glutamine amidotransferase-like domain-containing protein [Deltaproteobacteria bacterium]|uniref:BPL-N domain-containing protein n=1 Tax=Desulfobacula sp. TaxID=2593537 RepID=UPI0019A998AD|nr:Type 1 glutamine amidotransferase-like domain-containing protein [Candidatus Desulfobacula maris]MBL6993354.1 Type 1 glutamine amidotransferase-like domain-containing protein [Desulfobacula sp.]